MVNSRQFRRDAPMAPEIRAVGQGLVVDLDHPVVQIQGIGDRGSDFAVLGQNPDAVVVVADLEFPH